MGIIDEKMREHSGDWQKLTDIQREHDVTRILQWTGINGCLAAIVFFVWPYLDAYLVYGGLKQAVWHMCAAHAFMYVTVIRAFALLIPPRKKLRKS